MNSILKLTLSLIIALLIWSCEKDDVDILPVEIRVPLKNTEAYRYDLNISGDEEVETINIQANHFLTSELIRDSSTDWSVVYLYKPEAGFVGTDYVEIETCSGGQGANCANFQVVKIIFEVD